MNDGIKKIIVVVVLFAAIGAVITAKQLQSKTDSKPVDDVKVAGNNNVTAIDQVPLAEVEAVEVREVGKSVEDEVEDEVGEAKEVTGDDMETAAIAITEKALAEVKLPRLLELGSVTCIPCKMMKPIIDELKTEYEGSMKVEFIDVWADEAAGKKYKIGPIPTQIFFDAEGKELFRHIGFFPKEAILAKWQELGVELVEVK